MKILFLGEIGAGQTSRMRMRAMTRLGHAVQGVNTVEPWRRSSWLQRQLQRRLTFGLIVRDINKAILSAAREMKPDLVWAEKQEFLWPDTVRSVRANGAKIIHFTPDPYFSLSWKRTRLMDAAIAEFDVLVYCKSYEAKNYGSIGKPTVYMPLGYCDEVHRSLPSDDSQWKCRVGFLGGWEPRRERILHALAAAGLELKFRGFGWDFLQDGRWTLRRQIIMRQLAGADGFRVHHDPLLAAAHMGGEIYGDDYARALTGAAIGLGFLRTICADQHTTRTFEIPACGSMLLADRTEEHREFFEEGREAEFFSSEDELQDKASFYASDEDARRRIAGAGRQRCITGRYAYIHRVYDALKAVAAL